MIGLVVVLAMLVAVALAAPRYGVDTRSGPARRVHTVGADARALRARFGRAGRFSRPAG